MDNSECSRGSVQLASLNKTLDHCTNKVREQKMTLKCWLEDISIPVYIMVILFAVSSWVDINGLWVELPLMVDVLPEGWNLPSYLVIIIQIANIGPLIFSTCKYCWPGRIKEWPAIYLIISIGGISCFLLIFFWNDTSFIFGAEHSTGLLILSGFLALVDTTSSVVFLPYMGRFKPQYLTALYIGEGLSGFIPGIVGFIQGVGADPICINQTNIIQNSSTHENTTEWVIVKEYQMPAFTIEVFFGFLFGLLCLSMVSFTFLNFTSVAKKEIVNVSYLETLKDLMIDSPSHTPSDTPTMSRGRKYDVTASSDYQLESPSHSTGNYRTVYGHNDDNATSANVEIKVLPNEINGSHNMKLNKIELGIIFFLVAWINALGNGVLPSTGSYSAKPYGNKVYSIITRLTSIANPLACILTLFIQIRSKGFIIACTLFGSILAGYQIFLAASSPTPPIVGSWGTFLVIATSVLLTASFSYVKVMIASLLRDQGKHALLLCGIFTQVGSFFGAVIIFILINNLKLFTAAPYSDSCSN